MKTRDFRNVLAFSVAIAAMQACGSVGSAGSDIDARAPQAVRLVTVDTSTMER